MTGLVMGAFVGVMVDVGEFFGHQFARQPGLSIFAS